MTIPPKAVDSLECRVFKSFEDAHPIAEKWDEHLQLIGGPIYLSFHWCRIWWEFYGKGGYLRLYVFYVGNDIVGLFPLYFVDISVFPLKIRVARLIGSNNPPRVFNFAYPPELTVQMLASVSQELLKNDQCDLVSLGPLEQDEYLDGLLNSKGNFPFEEFVYIDGQSQGICSRFFLPDTFKDYLSTLSRNERSKYKRESRYLLDELGVQFNLENSSELIEEQFIKFMEMHTQRWCKVGRPGHFGAWDKAKEFNLALVRHFHSTNALRFFSMVLDGRPIYFMYSYVFGAKYFCILDARDELDETENVGLGRIGLMTTINFAISENAKEIEAGVGHYDHKIRLGALEEQLVQLHIKSSSLGTRCKIWIFLFYHNLLSTVYYKIWYQRIQPRLPVFFRKPINRLWIKLNI